MLFEIATDIPGFAVDEPVASLGQVAEAAGPVRAAAQGHRGGAARYRRLARTRDPSRELRGTGLPLQCNGAARGLDEVHHDRPPPNSRTFIGFVPATAPGRPPILLLHGTGGDENDLLPLGQTIAPGAALLSPRGKVLEGGMPRFFRRLAEGVFDEEDVRRRANELADFVLDARERLQARRSDRGRVLERSQYRRRRAAAPARGPCRRRAPAGHGAACRMSRTADLDGKPVLILSGATDPIVPAENASRLASLLKGAERASTTGSCRPDMASRRLTSP